MGSQTGSPELGMCGITGIFWPEAQQTDLEGRTLQMQCALGHRGPDDRGLFISKQGHCAMAHTRLSVIDLSLAGHQPMSIGEQDAKYWIAFNGEIYNYRELREELGVGNREQPSPVSCPRSDVRGQTSSVPDLQSPVSRPSWQSNTDTEVILRAYAKWGPECVQHLRGMFAFAIWDQAKQELFLARDPLGIKPLYYYQTKQSFLFASEIRALLASGLVPRKLSPNGLTSYLQYGSVQDPWTIIDGVRALRPGHSLVVGLANGVFRVADCHYAKDLFESRVSPRPASRSEAVANLRAKLEESVQMHLVSDVPLGAFLSGGIDSSAIVALMSRVTDRKPKTFSVVFEEAEFSEAVHARLVAKTFGTEHREIQLSEENLRGMLPSALETMDQPTMDGINTFVISKAVKDAGVTVALSGLGGDELFAGYPSFRRAQQLQKMTYVPRSLRRSASVLGRMLLNGSVRRQKFWDMVASDCSPYAACAISRQLFSSAEIEALTGREQRTEIRGQKSEIGNAQSEIRNSSLAPDALLDSPCSMLEADLINAVSRYELTGYMANTLLRDTDQMSMAHALEVRVPFVDPAVVQYVLGLPGEWKMDARRPKPLLLDALGGLLPEEVWKRPKMGFTLPFQRWMRSSLVAELEGTLSVGHGLTLLGINSDYVRAVWNAFNKDPQQEPWSRPWALYVLKRWCEINGVQQ